MNPRHDTHGDPLPPFALARLGTTRWRCGFPGLQGVAFSRDGATAFVTGAGVAALDAATGVVRWCNTVPSAGYCALLPDPAGDLLVTVGLGGSVSFFDAATGAPRGAFAQPSASLVTVAVSHDAETLLVGGFTRFGALLRRDGSTRATLSIDRGQYLHSATFAPDDATVVTTDAHAPVALTLFCLGVPDGVQRAQWKSPTGINIQGVVYAPAGDRLAVATQVDTRILDATTLREIARVEGTAASQCTLAFTHDGARLVTAGWDTTALMWSIDEAVAGYPRPSSGKASRRSRSR